MHQIIFRKLDEFFGKFVRLHYKKGATILRAGEDPVGVFYLKLGYVRVYSLSREGEELTLIIFKPEDFFPYMWAINVMPNEYYVEAMTQVELWRAPREEFLDFLKANDDVFFELVSRLIFRFGGLMRRMEYLVFGNAHNKVASIILICVDRFGEKRGKNIFIPVPLTHKEIANLVGITRETASIELQKLKTKALISYRGGHIMVRNLDKLRKESLLEEA